MANLQLDTPWTYDRIEELERLWTAGYSATEIAEQLGNGCTRCAVLGKINRLGLLRRRRPQPREGPPPAKRGRPIVRRPVFIAPPPPAETPPPPPRPDNPPRMRRLQLVQLADNHCRWPFGDPHRRPFYFCAADKAVHQPYCPYHLDRAFVKPRGR